MSNGENEGNTLKTLLIIILVITAITLVYLFIHGQSVREAGVPSDVAQVSEEASAAGSCESTCPVDACDALTGTDKQTCLLSCFAGKCNNEGAKQMAEKAGKVGIGCVADLICNEFCDLGTDPDCDNDGDGYPPGTGPGLDCNDNDPDIHPGAPEICNGIDDDCDGDTDEGDVCTPPSLFLTGTDLIQRGTENFDSLAVGSVLSFLSGPVISIGVVGQPIIETGDSSFQGNYPRIIAGQGVVANINTLASEATVAVGAARIKVLYGKALLVLKKQQDGGGFMEVVISISTNEVRNFRTGELLATGDYNTNPVDFQVRVDLITKKAEVQVNGVIVTTQPNYWGGPASGDNTRFDAAIIAGTEYRLDDLVLEEGTLTP